MKTFVTINENVTAQITEKKSKFIASLYYVESQEEINNIIKNVKKQYNDARHHCVAFRVLEEGVLIEKANDDGEPSGTAGAPMLKILQNNNLCNVLVIVTRYFGGILLGTGGLVRAYSESLQKAIENAKKVEKALGQILEIEITYQEFEKLKYYCEKSKIKIDDIKYSENIVCNLEILEENINKILEDLDKKSIYIKSYNMLDKRFINLL